MRALFSSLVLLIGSTLGFAQPVPDVPVSNWTVPPYAASTAGSGLRAMTDVTGPRAFVAVEPCRIVDTRLASFPAGFGPPSLSPGVERAFALADGPCPGLGTAAGTSFSLNVTVVTPAGPGHLVIWPTGSPAPTVSSINYAAGQTVANAVIVPAGDDGAISVLAGVSGAHLLIDVNGYFSSVPTSQAAFGVVTTSPNSTTAFFGNFSPDCNLPIQGCALYAPSYGSGAGRAIVGAVPSGGTNSAGVMGTQGAGFSAPTNYNAAGVRGEGIASGVLGVSRGLGVAGSLVDGSGGETAFGVLGFAGGLDPNCVGGGSCVGPWGVFAGGNIGATGTKHFLDPHPTDPTLAIGYVSLEGPEAGTYFRGRGKIQNGIARIAVPEHFRLVTDPEGLTVQVTPIGPMATVSVVKYDLNEIVVQGSRNVEFFYFVNGVRAAFKDVEPIRRNGEFLPRSADAKLPAWLSPAQKRVLIRNGTYREDGTVNVETARRFGWDRIWEERSRPAPEPASD